MSQITTLTFFKYATFYDKIWAFGMMQFAHSSLSNIEGLSFYKLLGSGKEGFNPFPDWSVYGVLQIWENEAAANEFFKSSGLMEKYVNHCKEHWTLYLKNSAAKGLWAGKNPFIKSDTLSEEIPFIAVITRATIKPKMLLKFWRYVPKSQEPLKGNKGLIYTKGLGELPIAQMATFSLWKDKKALMDFAYNSGEHKKAIEMTRKLNWYHQELFSRFQPYRSIGTWNGKQILPELNQ